MKTIFALIIFAASLLMVFSSCKKTEDATVLQLQKPPIPLDSMLLCHAEANLDSVEIHNALIGRWQWEYIKCFAKPENANGEDFKNLSIEFTQHDSLEVKLNGQKTQTSSWSLVRTNDGYFRLLMNPIVVQLPGKILFCGSHVLFYDSYVDGCDNYFKNLD